MAWNKLGQIYALSPQTETRSTAHMQGPVAMAMGNDRIRIYFAARAKDGKSYPAYIDVSFDDPTKVLAVQEEPVMPFGPKGTFDDEGIMPACILTVEHQLWMYYSGWNRRVTVPYHNTTGLASSIDGGNHFNRLFDGPILERTPLEPYMAVTPWVMRCGSQWKMWYVSGLDWVDIAGQMEPVYGIKFGESMDGIHWQRSGDLVIPQRHPAEAIARPTVIEHNGEYHMWYCYRDSIDFRNGKGSYKIGYAFSKDSHNWTRADHLAGINRSSEGWDSCMQCYPYVITANENLYLFYNGKSFLSLRL